MLSILYLLTSRLYYEYYSKNIILLQNAFPVYYGFYQSIMAIMA
jgi:hypothetical protein